MIIKVLLVLLTVQQAYHSCTVTFGINNANASGNADSHGYLNYEFNKPDENVETWVGRLSFTAEVQIFCPGFENDLPKSFMVKLSEENSMGGNLDNYMKALIADKDNSPEIPFKGIVVLQVNLDNDDSHMFIESDTFSWATNNDFDKGWIQDGLDQSKAGPTVITEEDPDAYAKFVENYGSLIHYNNESDFKKKRESFMEDVTNILPDIHEHPSKYQAVLETSKIDVGSYPVAVYKDGNTQTIEREEKEIVIFRIKVHMLDISRLVI